MFDLKTEQFVGMESWHCWSALDDSLGTGMPAFEQVYGTDFFSYLSQHPQKNDNWNRWNSVTAQEGFDGVVENLPLRNGESVCDIGGGQGELLHYILDEFPDCSATLLERPGVEIEEGAAFDWLAGDMFTGVPPGYDARRGTGHADGYWLEPVGRGNRVKIYSYVFANAYYNKAGNAPLTLW